jgi:hypothetical protein
MKTDDITWDGLRSLSGGQLKQLHKAAYNTVGSGSKAVYTEKFEQLRTYSEDQLLRAEREGQTSCQKYFPDFHDTTSCVMAGLCPCGVVSALVISVFAESVQVRYVELIRLFFCALTGSFSYQFIFPGGADARSRLRAAPGGSPTA